MDKSKIKKNVRDRNSLLAPQFRTLH